METDIQSQAERIRFLETQIKRQLDEKAKIDQKHRAEVAEVRQQKADAIKLADNWKERFESSATGGQTAALNRCQRELTEARSEIKLKSALFDEKARIANETATFLANRHAEDVRIIETERLLYQHKQESFEAMERTWAEKNKEYEQTIADLSGERGDKYRTSLSSVKEQEYIKSIEQLSRQIEERNKMIDHAESVFKTLSAEKQAMTSEIQRKDADLKVLERELHQACALELEARKYMQDADLSLDGAKRKIASLLKKQAIESDERQAGTSRVHKLELQLKNAEIEANGLREQLVRNLVEQRKEKKEWDDQRVLMETEVGLHKQKVLAITACLGSDQPDGKEDIGQEEGEEEMSVEAVDETRSIAPLPGRNTPAPETLSAYLGPSSPNIILSPSSDRTHSSYPLSSPRTRAPSALRDLFSSPSSSASPISRNNSESMITQPFRLTPQSPEPNVFLISSPRASKRSSVLEVLDREQVDDSQDIGKGVTFKRMRLESDRNNESDRGNETTPVAKVSSFPMVFSPSSKRRMSSSSDEEERRIKRG